MSRTIGDFMFKLNFKKPDSTSFEYALSNEADVKEFEFSKNVKDDQPDIEFILMGCDGIWDGAVQNSKWQNSIEPQGSQVMKFLR